MLYKMVARPLCKCFTFYLYNINMYGHNRVNNL